MGFKQFLILKIKIQNIKEREKNDYEVILKDF